MDIEQQVNRVWSPDVRPSVQEAWRCYSAGAYRACVALTWAAVSTDLIEKIVRLADDGDGEASATRDKIRAAKGWGLSAEGVRAMQDIERDLVEVATRLEIIDDVGARELARLREDRHLCVHPTFRSDADSYVPSAEYARAHLASALEAVLVQPPSQGRKAVDRFTAYVSDPTFVSSKAHILASFYDRVRPGTRRQIAELAGKHALLALDAPDPPGAETVAARMGECLKILTERDRGLGIQAVEKAMDRFATASSEVVLGALARIGDLEVLWRALPEPMVDRIRSLIDAQPWPLTDSWVALSDDQVGLLSLVGFDPARQVLPGLIDRFRATSVSARAAVMSRRVAPFFMPYVPSILRDAYAWRVAEQLTQQAVLPYASTLDVPTLDQLLIEWSENPQCRTAGGMLVAAVDLYRATPHLRPNDADTWRQFLDRVRAAEAEDSYYRYDDLEAALRRDAG